MRTCGLVAAVVIAFGCAGPQGHKIEWANEADHDLSKCTNIGLARGQAKDMNQEAARRDAAEKAAKMGGTTVRVSQEGIENGANFVEVQVFKCEGG